MNKTRLSNGFVFLCFLVSLGLGLFLLALRADNRLLNIFLSLFVVGLFGLALFGLYIFAAFLLLNARLLLKRERRSFANSLTLLLGLFLLGLMVGTAYINRAPALLQAVWSGGFVVVIFYLFALGTFVVSVLLANLAMPSKKQDYIIVLGSGLIDGGVPPLLARRIDRAIRFYKRQAKKRHGPPKLLMSGGQGPDEPRPEAAAMREYAIAQGIPAGDILVEDSSTTTAENMKFSKQLMDFAAAGKPYRCIYATNNYHLLRAGMLARRQGLRIDGIGARTAFYYLPNALLREFAAILWLNKRASILYAVAGFVAGLGLYLVF